MKTPMIKTNSDSQSETRNGQLTAGDCARILRQAARLLQDERSEGLICLSGMLRDHADRPIADLSVIANPPFKYDHPKAAPPVRVDAPPSRVGQIRASNGSARSGVTSGKPQTPLPANLKALSWEEVERILEDDTLTKRQIAEIGNERFGISRASLLRLRKDRARHSILTAMRNEKTMWAIADQARKAGKARIV